MTAQHELQVRAQRIRRLVLDVDGVLTDGTLFYGPDGEALKRFSVRDGLALKLAAHAGLESTIVTARRSPMVAARATDLGITHVIQGAEDKVQALEAVRKQHALECAEIAAIGDDLPDLPVFATVGLSFAPADAAPEVRAAATVALTKHGGDGAVREMVEHLLRLRDQWDALVAAFSTRR